MALDALRTFCHQPRAHLVQFPHDRRLCRRRFARWPVPRHHRPVVGFGSPLCRRTGAKPPYRRMRDAESAGDIHQALTCFATLQRLLPLMRRQLPRSPHMNATALARARPSAVRARISSRSNSASPSTVSINCPCGVGVSAHASAKDLNVAPALAIWHFGMHYGRQTSAAAPNLLRNA
jgi:hypothetical protein